MSERVILTPSEAKCRRVSSDLCTSTRSTADLLHVFVLHAAYGHSAVRGHRWACPVIDICRRSDGTHAHAGTAARRARTGTSETRPSHHSPDPPPFHVTRHENLGSVGCDRQRVSPYPSIADGRPSPSRGAGSRACCVRRKKKVKETPLGELRATRATTRG